MNVCFDTSKRRTVLPRPPGRIRSDSDAGATFAEVVACLAIAALCLVLASQMSYAGLRNIERARLLTELDARLVALDYLLRSRLWRIRPPLLAAHRLSASLSDGVRFFYLDGDPRRHLDIRSRPGGILVDDGRSNECVQGLRVLAIETRVDAGRPVVVVKAELQGGNIAEVCASCGTWPLAGPPAR